MAARSADRAKEIGMRKISGACRTHIVSQFLGESLLLSFTAFCGALLLTALLLPTFNALTGKSLAMSNGPLMLLAAFFIALLTVGRQSVKAARADPIDALRYE